MLQPRECLTAEEVRANAREVKARLRALTNGTSPSPAPVYETPQLLAKTATPEPAKPFQLIRGEFSALTLAEVPMAMWWRVIRDRVAAHYGFAPEALFSRWRGARLVEARHVAFYLTRMRTGMSHPAIGMKYGGRDHTTHRLKTLLGGGRKAALAVYALALLGSGAAWIAAGLGLGAGLAVIAAVGISFAGLGVRLAKVEVS